MARHTAKSHKIRKVEILVIQIPICRIVEKIKNPVTFSPFVRYWGETARKGGKDDETGL